MPLYLLIIAIQVACIVDVVRNRRNTIWIMALVFLPMASAAAYAIVEVLPRMKHNRHVREARAQIVEKIDPERELRSARGALDVAKTAANRIRLGDALGERARHGEALVQYRDAIGGGVPDYRLGEKLARAEFLSDQSRAALATLDAMGTPSARSDLDRIAVLRARVLEELGRDDEAAALYADVVERYPGDEVRCRYAGLLIRQGKKGDARRLLSEVEHRLKHMTRQQRAADSAMYDWAMVELAKLRT
ncbi:MAG: hypothetical protein ABIU10_03565 [Sphingomicrobium sp.]